MRTRRQSRPSTNATEPFGMHSRVGPDDSDWRRSSTARSPRWLDDSAGPGVGGGCDYGACDTGSFRNASRFFAPWEGCSIFYEARAGESYVEGGAAGAPTRSDVCVPRPALR